MSTAKPAARRGAPPDAPELTAAELRAAEAEALDARRLVYCRLVHALFEVMDLAYGPNQIHAQSPAGRGGAVPRRRSSRHHETGAARSGIPGKEWT